MKAYALLPHQEPAEALRRPLVRIRRLCARKRCGFFSFGNLAIRSQAIQSNPGGNNSINMTGNSTTGEGTVSLKRGKHDGSSRFFSLIKTEHLYNFIFRRKKYMD